MWEKAIRFKANPDRAYIIVDVKNYEDRGSCSYDRIISYVPYEAVKEDGSIDQAVKHTDHIKGTQLPYTYDESLRPYKIDIGVQKVIWG